MGKQRRRAERDAQRHYEDERAGDPGPILVTEGAARAIVEIRDLYAKDGTDEDLLRCALHEIRDARGRRVSQAAIAMQSDALDAALARAQALEESVEISKQQTRDVEIERDDARAEIRRLKAWRTRAQEAEANHARAVEELVAAQEYAPILEGEVERLRGVVEAIAKGTEHVISITAQAEEEIWQAAAWATIQAGCHPEFPEVADRAVEEFRKRYRQVDDFAILEPLRERLEDAPEDPAQGVEESDRAWLIRRGWTWRGGTLDEWWHEHNGMPGGMRLFGTAAVAQQQRADDASAARIAALPVLAYGYEFILEWKGAHRTKLFVHSYSWTEASGRTTITCGPTPPGGEPA